MLKPQGRSALTAFVLAAAAAAAALGGGQDREAPRGQEIPPTFGAKVVTEHVPVLPHLLRTTPHAAPTKAAPAKDVAARMGFRPVPAKNPTVANAAPPEPAPPSVPTPPRDAWYRAGRARMAVADYEGAAAQFHRSARESEKDGDALLAMAVALAARGEDERAARSLRKAIRREPGLLDRAIDPAGDFRDAAEFDRVIGALEERAAAVPGNADAKFVLAIVRLLRNDDRCHATFAWLKEVTPKDDVAVLCGEAAARRFPAKKKVTEPAPDADRREGVEK